MSQQKVAGHTYSHEGYANALAHFAAYQRKGDGYPYTSAQDLVKVAVVWIVIVLLVALETRFIKKVFRQSVQAKQGVLAISDPPGSSDGLRV